MVVAIANVSEASNGNFALPPRIELDIVFSLGPLGEILPVANF
jgi:hypothetical protein